MDLEKTFKTQFENLDDKALEVILISICSLYDFENQSNVKFIGNNECVECYTFVLEKQESYVTKAID